MAKDIKINFKILAGIICGIFFVLILNVYKFDKVYSLKEYRHQLTHHQNLPIIYAITPTFYRSEQKAELTRLSQTLMLVPNLHWIVVEDADSPTALVTKLLNRSGLSYTQLFAETNKQYKMAEKDPHWSKPRGVEQRNVGLEWLRQNISPSQKGVVYFMDDDNVYSLRLFEEMTTIKTVGVWPVGLVGGLMVEKPIVDTETKKVTGFNAVWKPERPFPMDMAGFAINLQLLLQEPNAKFSNTAGNGMLESEILRHLVVMEDLEPLANLCTEVNVWHTRTEKPKLFNEVKHIKKFNKRKSDDNMEV